MDFRGICGSLIAEGDKLHACSAASVVSHTESCEDWSFNTCYCAAYSILAKDRDMEFK
jgi:hypothetical protein